MMPQNVPLVGYRFLRLCTQHDNLEKISILHGYGFVMFKLLFAEMHRYNVTVVNNYPRPKIYELFMFW